MLPHLGATVRYFELGREFAAMITKAQENESGLCNLTVFGTSGEAYRTAPFSKELKEGHWSLAPQAKAK